jgi:hypothetical protein
MIVDIATREGRGRAFDLLVMERASVLIVPCLAQLTRKSGELAHFLAHYFSAPSGVADLIAVADRLDTRTPQGRIAVNVLRCLGQLDNGGVYHA